MFDACCSVAVGLSGSWASLCMCKLLAKLDDNDKRGVSGHVCGRVSERVSEADREEEREG